MKITSTAVLCVIVCKVASCLAINKTFTPKSLNSWNHNANRGARRKTHKLHARNLYGEDSDMQDVEYIEDIPNYIGENENLLRVTYRDRSS